MITIVKFRAYDKPLEKNFYQGETIQTIHQALTDICNTYIPIEILTVSTQANTLLTELLKYQP